MPEAPASLPSQSSETNINPSFSQKDTILLLGSGALKIGEAGEFDYSGSQAIKAFKEEDKHVLVVNPNIATHQTSWDLADGVYFVPVTPHFVRRIIEKERPGAIALSFGGQTALNCGIALHDDGTLKKYNVEVLGTPIESIRKTEDRALFKEELRSINVSVARSHSCHNVSEGLRAAENLHYPVIARGAFSLGGKGSGRAENEEELRELLETIFVESFQVLVEEDLTGWKEIEYEVVRDQANNCITVCNMENVDPMGIHTGESIVVAPSQTLDNTEYQLLRSVALKTIRHLGIVGECNIQYALHPHSREYRVIEVNARLSRSSALASKATGYPLAFIAAKLALGSLLPDVLLAITHITSADFEPALDYIALKAPRWDLQKFRNVSHLVSSEMKSVGEVMAIDRSFEAALQKALRMLNIGAEGIVDHPFTFDDIEQALVKPTPHRIFAVAEALKAGSTPQKIHDLTGIDLWFIECIRRCVDTGNTLSKATKDTVVSLLPEAKKSGFCDASIATRVGSTPQEIRTLRKKHGIIPVVKQIDTLAGEFPAKTNYLYLTYHGIENDVQFSEPNSVLVLGSGPYSIGSSVEFDWCCVEAAHELRRQGKFVAMLNSNPETVSTDYDECDALFFDELTEERIRDICDLLQESRVLVSMGGQIPNSLAPKLHAAHIPILGTTPENIDQAEDRHKFSKLLDKIGIDQPRWKEFADIASARIFAEEVGYPVIVRPSYVLSGAAMAVVHSPEELGAYLEQAASVGRDAPIVLSKFEDNAKEIEFDGVAQNGKLLLYAIAEHIENAGVHSGDATIVLPPQRLNLETLRRMKHAAKAILQELDISGPFNIQFLAKNNALKVIECNLRSSRSFPFVSKVTGENFARLATQAILGIAPEDVHYQTLDLDYVAVKAAQFSFSRLKGADPQLGVEMASTGEVACFGENAEQALLLSLLAVSFRLPTKSVLVTIGELDDKIELLPSIRLLYEQGLSLYATNRTYEFLKARGIPSVHLYKIHEPRSPNVEKYLQKKRIDLVINIPLHPSKKQQKNSFTAPLLKPRTQGEREQKPWNTLADGYHIRRLATDRNISLITNVQLAKRFIDALFKENPDELPLLRWPNLLP